MTNYKRGFYFMKNTLAKLALISFALLANACKQEAPASNEPAESSNAPVVSESVPAQSSEAETFVDNQLSNKNGMTVYFNKTGAKIDKIEYDGKKIAENGFTVGRCANRIAGGKFTLNGTEYNVSKNDGNNSLHGGRGKGGNSWQGPFATNDWTRANQTASSIEFTYHSADGENGYPGNMDMTVKYTLNDQGELGIEYKATCDADSLCNPTNHLFISLNGNTSYDNIKLQINADKYTPLASQLPTGELADVAGTKFDYREEKAFSKNDSYDDNYVIKGTKDTYRKAATMTSTTSNIKLDVYSDRAGLQLYKENNGKICLETQQFPDAINHENFLEYGTTIIKANVPFTSKTTYHFQKIA